MLYGLHPNAEIGFLTTTSETLFKTVFELQPRESGSSGGPVTTREDKIKALVDDVMEKLPEAFNMSEIMGKVEERTPYVVVAFQVQNLRFLKLVFTYLCLHLKYCLIISTYLGILFTTENNNSRTCSHTGINIIFL